ncbi:hypothetical protein [Serratia quinivorans]|uniref:hypothetical protein n=1 Tax=Serratia quinivorans TaxID=137545 RepID=UPI002179978E|nr:hypothetical protein [Serratia quinivorans]CAI1122429.1 Uncharacterised protein [Serratia quinivorans]CAI1151847.1 Uncharacterised protein [Serratia quinivorans]CAI1832156.1 Uncharacterised protein [Serratia quinivorans]CAI2139894.1 Uncharacterised protein [Serratia quinivorans]CAI2150405.1 Uncharacterised protein [Serratia quinivorans]
MRNVASAVLAVAVLAVVATVSISLILGKWHAASTLADEISCRADLNIISIPEIQFMGVMKIHAVNGKGVILYAGSYRQQSGASGLINRKVFFNYKKNKDMLYMVSYKATVLPSDNAAEQQISALLPRFFYTPDITHNVGLYKQGNGNIFAGTIIPFLYCAKG